MARVPEELRAPPGLSEYRVRAAEVVDAACQLLLALEADPVSAAPTLAEFAPRFIQQWARANRHKPSGVDSQESHFKHHLLPALGSTPIDRISGEQIQALKASLSGRSAKTVNNVLSTLRKALKVAVEWEVIRAIPVRISPLSTLRPEMRFYEKAEYERLILGARSAGPLALCLVLLGGDCGLRKGELVALEWKDVDFVRSIIHIQRSETRGKVTAPKGGRDRWVPMTYAVREALKSLPRNLGPRVFYRADGQEMGKQRLVTPMMQAQRQCGMTPDGALHVLRHTFCSHLASAGVPAKAIQELAGHESLQTTERYMHLAPREKGRAIEQLELYRRRD